MLCPAASKLAERSHLERPRVSRHVADLVTKKLFERVGDPDDRRRAWIAITVRGRALHAEFFPESVQLNNFVLSTLSAAELAAFDLALSELTQSADDLVKSRSLQEKVDRRHGGRRRGSAGQADELPLLVGTFRRL